MSNVDLLVVAGDAAEKLEQHGVVACGRRQNGVTRVDFWTMEGELHSYVMNETDTDVDAVVLACLAKLEVPKTPMFVHQFDTKN